MQIRHGTTGGGDGNDSPPSVGDDGGDDGGDATDGLDRTKS